MFRIPKHIGIIPDGNRRWAKKSGLKKEEGYDFGLEPGLELLRAANVLGNTESSCFPKELIPYTEPETSPGSDSDKMRVNLLVNYGWEWDMKHDWVSKMIPRVDLVIRWGGMCRLSGFLPLQTVYSDFCIIQELWPDFKEEQFEYALNWYQKQDVTLGG